MFLITTIFNQSRLCNTDPYTDRIFGRSNTDRTVLKFIALRSVYCENRPYYDANFPSRQTFSKTRVNAQKRTENLEKVDVFG